ncbi:MAG: hypothetical protein KAI02_07415 [Gammaproteobacteria bacterium]|nr:hypothetical protein [Bacteroidales bacterium]MCK5697973.1 hypothetical protein [Gammaproteobacteria bacterium]
MTIIKHSMILIMLSLFLVACKSAPILNIDEDAFNTDKPLTMQEVTTGIERAGHGLGWRMENKKPGLIIGTLHLRDHMAKVSIQYNTKYYSIYYQDSSNLDYKEHSSNYEGQSVIHSNYNGWIQNLNNAIHQQVY